MVRKQGWFDRNQTVLEECFDDLMDISVQNINLDAWAGTIVVKRNGKEVLLTCAGCEGIPFDKTIGVDGNWNIDWIDGRWDGKDQAPTWCLNGKICKLTLQGRKGNNSQI